MSMNKTWAISSSDLLLDLGRHVPTRFIHILRCPVEEIKIDNRTSALTFLVRSGLSENHQGGRTGGPTTRMQTLNVRVKLWRAKKFRGYSWNCGCISITDHEGRQFWVAAAEREGAGRFIVHAHDMPTPFLEKQNGRRFGNSNRMILLDPWNAAGRDEKARVYLVTFGLNCSVLPIGDDAPALRIVAHTRSRERFFYERAQ